MARPPGGFHSDRAFDYNASMIIGHDPNTSCTDSTFLRIVAELEDPLRRGPIKLDPIVLGQATSDRVRIDRHAFWKFRFTAWNFNSRQTCM